jgi:enoyl-CoA hydratase
MSTPETTEPEVLIELRGRVGLITLNRPRVRNALNRAVMAGVVAALRQWDVDPGVGAIVITGAGPHFAAGADIREMADKSFIDVHLENWVADWNTISGVRTPIIAAVRGTALGGGCELAMLCDYIIAGDDAVFGQPEIKLGVLPGMGGSQRLTRAIGKAKAMEMILTGRTMGATEAEQSGLVARVVPSDSVLDEALASAVIVAEMSLPVAMMAKEVVNEAFESGLASGVRFERRVFHSAFATDDQKEGMLAFLEKRAPSFRHR